MRSWTGCAAVFSVLFCIVCSGFVRAEGNEEAGKPVLVKARVMGKTLDVVPSGDASSETRAASSGIADERASMAPDVMGDTAEPGAEPGQKREF